MICLLWHHEIAGIPYSYPDFLFITLDTNYFLQMGMYAVDLEEYANRIAIDHLKKYNYNWGVPCAPEAMGDDYEFAGDQYSDFNAGKILVILEGIFGLSYSVVEDEFTVADNLEGMELHGILCPD